MKAHLFIHLYGVDTAEKVVSGVVCNATHYSAKTGSYYSVSRPHAVEIRKLPEAISEYKRLEEAKSQYETRLKHWDHIVNKALSDYENEL